MKSISVVIPCYNAANYIDRCMDSVVAQTMGLDGLEIILVNDASADDTIGKLLEWEEKYSEQVLVVDCEENNGCGGARNVGIQYASGEYLFFLDADDWIEPDALEQLLFCSDGNRYDIVSGKMIFDRPDDQTDLQEIRNYEALHRCDQRYQAKKVNDLYVWEQRRMNEGNVGGMPTSVGALYRRKRIIDHELFFPEKVDYEDNFWKDTLKIYFPNMYVMDKVIYHYCYNGDSITQKRNSIKLDNRLFMELNILEYYKQTGAYEYYQEDLESNFIRRFYLNTVFVIFTNYDYIPDIINYLRKTVKRLFPDYEKSYLMDTLNVREQMLIRLLQTDADIEMDEMIKIRSEYLQLLRAE